MNSTESNQYSNLTLTEIVKILDSESTQSNTQTVLDLCLSLLYSGQKLIAQKTMFGKYLQNPTADKNDDMLKFELNLVVGDASEHPELAERQEKLRESLYNLFAIDITTTN